MSASQQSQQQEEILVEGNTIINKFIGVISIIVGVSILVLMVG